MEPTDHDPDEGSATDLTRGVGSEPGDQKSQPGPAFRAVSLATWAFGCLLIFFVADECWMAFLEARSPAVPSPAFGLTVGLQRHAEWWQGPMFYVRPFDAAVHYVLLTVAKTALVVASWLMFRREVLGRS